MTGRPPTSRSNRGIKIETPIFISPKKCNVNILLRTAKDPPPQQYLGGS